MGNQDYYKNGKIFCGNRKCNLMCERNAIHVPYGIPFLQENYKLDKDGRCKYYEEMKL